MSELTDLFADLPEPIQAGIRELKWTEPMAVQSKVIPPMRDGQDLIVQAHTGSGKTGAFGISIVAAIDPDLAECQALVMTPTRELAGQVSGEIEVLGRHCGIRTLPIYGGVGYTQQLDAAGRYSQHRRHRKDTGL